MSLSRERITAAALELAAEDGLEALSMRKVAAQLGVEAMSLYRHVAHKADLLDAMHDALLSRVSLPGDGPWADEVRAVATSFRDVLLDRPRLVPLVATRPARRESGLLLVSRGVDILMRAGFDEAGAVVAFQTVFAFVVGHAVFHTAGGALPPGEAWAREEFTRGLEIIVAGLESALRAASAAEPTEEGGGRDDTEEG